MDVLISNLPLVVVLCVGIFVQSAAGFAAGLLIVPSLLWFDYTIPEAQCSLLVATIPQNVWGVWSLRDSITVRQVAMPGLGRVLFLPLGVLTLQSLESLDVTTIRQVVGGIVLLVTLTIIRFRPRPRESLNPIWAILAFPLSGFFQGLVGMGGPAMVFWVQAHDWGSRQMRAFMFSMYLISIVPALSILYWFFGQRIVWPGLIAAGLTPLLLVVTVYGLRLGTRLGRHRLRRISVLLLLLIGVAGLAAPLITPG
jgi:uncharacterized membrane protein YfcA